jgi:hypothetical protein
VSGAAFAFSGKHIFVPSHRWPHQQNPSALMMQVPVPQQRVSSMVSFLVDGSNVPTVFGSRPMWGH